MPRPCPLETNRKTKEYIVHLKKKKVIPKSKGINIQMIKKKKKKTKKNHSENEIEIRRRRKEQLHIG